MSLTSYRAAPPRGCVFLRIDRLEDLAATYSPVP